MAELTPRQHKNRHIKLHRAFDELLADFISQNPNKGISNTNLLELMQWSFEQTKNPTEPKI